MDNYFGVELAVIRVYFCLDFLQFYNMAVP
jgi:hypothetical protein